ncbi:helix-turn-helix transcriptional regulator [Geminicoccus roseus]|uniref:helix-turn-helix transcriptional regulator n=1 Tax=Geminicoccus roseus TaxID=404900 RepID=UPI000405540D|nr:helix-turn-helix transcriptional regulator [Geminicoccus roseus]
MMTHSDVWVGIDRLAAKNGFSASGLAKRAGLDPTTFNKSKRATKAGKARWPSTESIAKILEATMTPMAEFVALMNGTDGEEPAPASRRLRSLPLDRAATGQVFDASGFPIGDEWEDVDFPGLDDGHAYALELGEDLAPYWRRGDVLVVSPASSTRRGDRILLRDRKNKLHLGIMSRRTAQRVVVDLPGGSEESWAIDEVAWIARIVWASQ